MGMDRRAMACYWRGPCVGRYLKCRHGFHLLLRSSIHSLLNRNEKTDDPEVVHQKNFKIPAKTNSAATNIDQSEWHASQSAGLRASTITPTL